MPAGASIVKYGQPTTCSSSSKVRAAEWPSLRVISHRPGATATVLARRLTRNDPGVRNSKYSSGGRRQSSHIDSERRAAGTRLSVISGMLRGRSEASAGPAAYSCAYSV